MLRIRSSTHLVIHHEFAKAIDRLLANESTLVEERTLENGQGCLGSAQVVVLVMPWICQMGGHMWVLM